MRLFLMMDMGDLSSHESNCGAARARTNRRTCTARNGATWRGLWREGFATCQRTQGRTSVTDAVVHEPGPHEGALFLHHSIRLSSTRRKPAPVSSTHELGRHPLPCNRKRPWLSVC